MNQLVPQLMILPEAAGRKGVLNDSTKWFKDDIRGHVLSFDELLLSLKKMTGIISLPRNFRQERFQCGLNQRNS